MAYTRITLSLDDERIRKAKILAAYQSNGNVSELFDKLIDEEWNKSGLKELDKALKK